MAAGHGPKPPSREVHEPHAHCNLAGPGRPLREELPAQVAHSHDRIERRQRQLRDGAAEEPFLPVLNMVLHGGASGCFRWGSEF